MGKRQLFLKHCRLGRVGICIAAFTRPNSTGGRIGFEGKAFAIGFGHVSLGWIGVTGHIYKYR